MANPTRRYRAALLTPTDAGELLFMPDAVLEVDPQGRIASISDYQREPHAHGLLQDLRGHLIVPGFVDTHLHVPQTRVIGSAAGPLLEWLDSTVFPEEARFADTDYAAQVAHQFLDCCGSVGTTTFMAFATSHPAATERTFEICVERGFRATLGLTLMDQNCPPALRLASDVALQSSRELAQRFHGAADGLIRFAVTPRFALSCSRPLLEGAAKLSEELQLPIQTHISENAREGVETLIEHPYAADYLGVYEAVGLLTSRTILAHAIHLTASEWERLAASGAAIAHCPDSNAFLGSGKFNLGKALAHGIRTGLGSDVAAGRSFDLRRASSHAFDTAREVGVNVSAAALFERATLEGARALGLAHKVGSLEPGKDADFVVLSTKVPQLDQHVAVRLAGFGAELAPVARTYVRGRLVFDARSSF